MPPDAAVPLYPPAISVCFMEAVVFMESACFMEGGALIQPRPAEISFALPLQDAERRRDI